MGRLTGRRHGRARGSRHDQHAVEAKVQAVLDAGYDCSGTPTDAVCVAARTAHPGEELHAFAGPRSQWGARLARAVHRAVRGAIPTP
ncbi:hypothetical protein BGK67_31815 [Streptomyces subrutilus]|uniref:Uncharacterized protein n=1 Tax=Streptomyces subrutilus TaxID=36818 RepID=A0A1E5Q053_9ACTN|nr:hypothetical protein BGK67_31815 [Streptomyces subrutilus]